jgi:hypothetical protein
MLQIVKPEIPDPCLATGGFEGMLYFPQRLPPLRIAENILGFLPSAYPPKYDSSTNGRMKISPHPGMAH